MLADLVQNSLDGLAAGAAYALLALGFTLIFGVLRRANLSYGPAIMFGCYAAALTHQHFGAGLFMLALVTIAGAVLAGAYVERLCFAPHREGSAIAAMVASFALWMQFEELAALVLPGHLYAFPMLHEGAPLALGAFTFRIDALVLLAVAILVCASLWWMLYRSRFGLAVRAVIEQPTAASLAGINVPRVLVRVFALASAIGGVAGYLVVASNGQITPMLGMWATLKGLLAMMLGGLGSLPGAVLGGLALGLIEAHSQWYLGPQMRDLIAYLLLFVLLAARVPWMTSRSAS
ncbi:MAG: branched-chain amino acid ABC transporter permease [Betaproteobacteria bacterium]|nr:branched-chain amino acid ABC transporter permease [Betaproteobacteria bacterium]MDH5221500.1 branched-chain amino acid ABC transporter permease [Betaproteobacteria bacterium]MDH5352365.1 branched-chain amino acid ABC transporter permease [Betaproteobacteria bacterium]